MSLLDDKLETFITVCEVKNFTKAGEILGLTQPAVSQHVKKLEEELGTQVFCAKRGKSCSRKKEKSHFCMQKECTLFKIKCAIKSKTRKRISEKSE